MTKCESFPLMIFLGSSYRKHSANYRDKCSYRQSPLAANLFFADKGKKCGKGFAEFQEKNLTKPLTRV
jgi:hypothetical protein